MQVQATEPKQPDQRTVVRMRAWELKQLGWTQKDIASSLGVSQTAVSNWVRKVRQGGPQSLRTRHSPGAPSRLDGEQQTSLLKLLEDGPTTHGFTQRNWTYFLIADLISQKFSVTYHQSHIPKLLKKLNWVPPHKRQR
ncbi:MAG TPA: transposase [Candidatus Latescibacteria bacterium]|nr:transposase [Candidatus Handelsmanbacteria bacterium]HIL11984.1 transposase [Candidatus Latescibacterota bacterium]